MVENNSVDLIASSPWPPSPRREGGTFKYSDILSPSPLGESLPRLVGGFK